MSARAIWKYPLDHMGPKAISMPASAKILSVISQHDIPTLYAMVDPDDKESKNVTVMVLGTGHFYSEDEATEYTFLGTVSTARDRLIWHVLYRE